MPPVSKGAVAAIVILSVVVVTQLVLLLVMANFPILPVSKLPEDVYHVTFGGGKPLYAANAAGSSKRAMLQGATESTIFNARTIADSYQRTYPHLPAPETQRGHGYWRWKPVCILELADRLPENALIVYTDSGLNIRDLRGLIKTMEVGTDVMIFINGHTNRRFTTRACRAALDVTDRELDSMQMDAAFLMVRNNERMRDFMKLWIHTMRARETVEDEDPSVQQEEHFKDHRHDQTVVSILLQREHEKGRVTAQVESKYRKMLLVMHHRARSLAMSRLMS